MKISDYVPYVSVLEQGCEYVNRDYLNFRFVLFQNLQPGYPLAWPRWLGPVSPLLTKKRHPIFALQSRLHCNSSNSLFQNCYQPLNQSLSL